MALDPTLLAEARAAEERLIEAEHAADLARADFNRAVRRLQLGGASIRETAGALGLSHQRVHQIVEAAGGSRRWRKRRDTSEPCYCSFCGCEEREANKLVAGPGVYICDGCVDAAVGVLATGQAATTPVSTIERVGEEAARARCSFCTKHRHQVTGLAVAPSTGGDASGRKVAGAVHICSDCLTLCREIIDEELG